MYPYAIIGNCQVAALVRTDASIDWYCLPRPDSPPVFGRLLDEDGGHFSITSPVQKPAVQRYTENTNVLETFFEDTDGNSFVVIDFAPRFEQYGRVFRPTTIIRIVRVISGTPQIVVSCRPVNGWWKHKLQPRRGNSHVQFPGLSDEFRLTTNLPLSYLIDEIPTTVTQTVYFALTWGLPVEDDLPTVCEAFLKKTVQYWRYWIKTCSIPSEFQQETIRSALALKLHCYEETGAILAAITTSLPEEYGGVRNWDYRYCWLRDACFTVTSFYKLGHFEELENLLLFIINVLQRDNNHCLHPVYRLDGTLPLPENDMDNWTGFQQSGPVRVGNQAAEHIQNDVYGEILLILAPLYFDDRFSYLREGNYASLFERMAARAYAALTEKDAGLWEHRSGWKIHSFTILMSWAGLDRYETLLAQSRIPGDLETVRQWTSEALTNLRAAAFEGVVLNSLDDHTPDASLLLMATLRFPDQDISQKTLSFLHRVLGVLEEGKNEPVFLYRYMRGDDFGKPHHAFVICTYWLVEALAKLNEPERARKILASSLRASNHVGLFSEHFDVERSLQTGNFPQCYSHVGLINAAFSVSADWDKIL